MALVFYPHEDDAKLGTPSERITILLEAAERYKAAVLEEAAAPKEEEDADKRGTPHDLLHAYNWSEIARMLEQVRGLPEGNASDKAKKASLLTQLAEVYEVLRGAKMPKLEAVRLALVNEANQLGVI